MGAYSAAKTTFPQRVPFFSFHCLGTEEDASKAIIQALPGKGKDHAGYDQDVHNRIKTRKVSSFIYLFISKGLFFFFFNSGRCFKFLLQTDVTFEAGR